MRIVDTRNFHYRSCPELILADCRNEIEALQNLNHLAVLDATSNSPQHLHLIMIEEHLSRLADMLFLPA